MLALKNFIQNTSKRLKHLFIAEKEKPNSVSYELKPAYCNNTPSHQNLIDIFKGGWYSSFPPELGIKAGTVDHFESDPRVQWVNRTLVGGLKNFNVLELGPYEAYNTWQLDRLGVKNIVSIENKKISYLKCLIVKEITGLKAAFLLGDFIPYLEQCEKTFDIVWASGVLYHQVQPLNLLKLISKVSSRAFIHTHYYGERYLCENPELMSEFQPDNNSVVELNQQKITLHYKSYLDQQEAIFSGGANSYSYWLEKEDIFACLDHLGFKKITMEVDDPRHDNGPAMCFLAEK